MYCRRVPFADSANRPKQLSRLQRRHVSVECERDRRHHHQSESFDSADDQDEGRRFSVSCVDRPNSRRGQAAARKCRIALKCLRLIRARLAG